MTEELMYDSTNPAAIPDSAPIVVVYIDGLYRAIWAAALAAGRFANTPKRRIACVTTNTRSDTADFERFDLTPLDGPIWYRNMIAMGESDLWAYCNRANRTVVEDVMWNAGIRDLKMWIATLDGVTKVVAPYRYPVAAVQYTDTGSVDLSVVYDLGADMGLTPDQDAKLTAIFNATTQESTLQRVMNDLDPVAYPIVGFTPPGGGLVKRIIASLPPGSGLTQQQVTDACITALKEVTFTSTGQAS